jgi:hypothetical protein
MLSGFGYLLSAGVAFFFLFLVAGVLDHVKNHVEVPGNQESPAIIVTGIIMVGEQKSMEDGENERKLEEVD